MARLCNVPVWEVEDRSIHDLKPWIELLVAVDQANQDISEENERRAKQKDNKSFLRRITLAD